MVSAQKTQAQRLQAVERRKEHRLKMARKMFDAAKEKISQDYTAEEIQSEEVGAHR